MPRMYTAVEAEPGKRQQSVRIDLATTWCGSLPIGNWTLAQLSDYMFDTAVCVIYTRPQRHSSRQVSCGLEAHQ